MPDGNIVGTLEGLLDTREDYEFADLDSEDMESIADAERQLNARRNRGVILLAYEKRPH